MTMQREVMGDCTLYGGNCYGLLPEAVKRVQAREGV